MESLYLRNLKSAVLKYSDSSNWNAAVYEWEIYDVDEDDTLSESCVCGKENLRYLFTIKNKINGNILYPIGSSCIHKFERKELNDLATIKEQLFKLLHAVESNEFIELTSEYFTRKLLRYLYDNDAFESNQYNGFDAYKDYQFLIDMFNKRNRTYKQNQKATAIILNSIKPYLEKLLKDKIKR